MVDATLTAIHRHPIKGFTAEALDASHLTPGGGLPFDRHFGFVSGQKEDQPAPGKWVQPRTFFMLTLFPELACFDCKLLDKEQILRITNPHGKVADVVRGKPDTFAAANDLLCAHFDAGPHGKIRLVEQDDTRGNWDFSDTEISIINLATLRVISKTIGRELEKERFRGNLYIDGLEPWEEFSWPGCQIQIGEARLDVLRPIQRCAMTSTEPGTGLREIDVPKSMFDAFGHHFCGVYARVSVGGQIQSADNVVVMKRDAFNPHDSLPERVAAPSLWPRFVTRVEQENAPACYTSTASNWPLPIATPGQTVRTHPTGSVGTSSRTKLSHSDQNGWFVDRNEQIGPLVSGPYGHSEDDPQFARTG